VPEGHEGLLVSKSKLTNISAHGQLRHCRDPVDEHWNGVCLQTN